MIDHYLNLVANLLPWADVFTVIAASGILVPLLVPVYKLVKKWFEHHKGVMEVIVLLITLGGSAVHYLLTTPTADPSIMALQGFGAAILTKPWYAFLKMAWTFMSVQVGQAKVIAEQAKTSALPSDVAQ